MHNTHTPGPWQVRKVDGHLSIFVPSERGLTCEIAERIGGEVFKDASGAYRDYSRVEANARLIAAAPDLLEALVAVLNYCVDDEGQPTIATARAAIAKATGGQP